MSTISEINTLTSGLEFRCDVCSEFMPFDMKHIDAHYKTQHANAKTTYKERVDIATIMRFWSYESSEHLRGNAVFNASLVRLNAHSIENDAELSFIPADVIDRARHFANIIDGKLYKFKTLADGKAHKILELDNNKTFDFDYFISEDERKRAARSMFDQDINLNHYLYSPYFNFVVEAEDVNGALVGLALISDPLFNALYDNNLVVGVSVEYYKRKEVCNCSAMCKCEHYGVIYRGLGIISVPSSPADANSEFIHVLANTATEFEASEVRRIIAETQAGAKQLVTASIAQSRVIDTMQETFETCIVQDVRDLINSNQRASETLVKGKSQTK